METSYNKSLDVKKIQLSAIILLCLFPFIQAIATLCNTLGIIDGQNPIAPQTIIHIGSLINAICGLTAYLLLTRITSNLPTRLTIKNVGIFLFIVYLLSIAYNIYLQNSDIHTITPILRSSISSTFFILKITPILYLCGVISRNNPECRQAKNAITIYVVMAQIVPTIMRQVCLTDINIIQLSAFLTSLFTILSIYMLFTSDVFNGKISHEAAPKGAYRFWNKYMGWYFIALIIGTILLAIIAF